jgi:hypothetical protein
VNDKIENGAGASRKNGPGAGRLHVEGYLKMYRFELW